LPKAKSQEQSLICIRIWGGLANQMFQYAAGFSTAQRLGCELLMDPVASGADHATYGLDLFGLKTRFWNPDPPKTLLSSLKGRFRSERKNTKKRYTRWPGAHFSQKSFCTGEGFEQIEAGTYMQGYFQSEDFFANHQIQIREIFSLAHLQADIDPSLRVLATRPNSVSVHIRRGDYATNPKTTKVHGLLPLSYYSRALSVMQKMHGELPVLVFSDDIETADALTENWPNRTLIRNQSREQDLYLMSKCANHIIGNSSFSWWGAWLNPDLDKTVIAPRRWFSREEMRKTYVDDLYPQGWLLV